MKKTTQALITSFVFLLLSVGDNPANAGTATGQFNVTASIADNCTIDTANNLAFNNYDPSADRDVATTIDLTCTNGTAYDLRLNQGSHGTSVTSRQMKHTSLSDLLNYKLFKDSSRSQNWGETDGTDTVQATGDGTQQSHTVYGRITQNQNAKPVGNYSDTITVTVNFP